MVNIIPDKRRYSNFCKDYSILWASLAIENVKKGGKPGIQLPNSNVDDSRSGSEDKFYLKWDFLMYTMFQSDYILCKRRSFEDISENLEKDYEEIFEENAKFDELQENMKLPEEKVNLK